MKLHLTRPLVFFDLETTGIDVSRDHIVELSYIKVMPDGCEVSKTLRLRPATADGRTVPIPATSTAVHGISDDDVKDCPTFRDVADELLQTFSGCDLAGYNSNKFDIPLLVEEFLRIGKSIDLSQSRFIDVQNIYHKLEQRTLVAAYRHYCHKELTNAHSADADTRATLEVLEAQLDTYPDTLQNDVAQLAEFSAMNRNIDFAGRFVKDEQGNEVINFGKYKGRLVKEVFQRDPSFVSWMLQGDFTLDTKSVAMRLNMKYKRK
ncbi:MAG: 3'-5' exonuclease [Bacteroidaceae bacterium]|nr:3'-5' exonuclease [Bacteroidaceae bacterium]MDO4993642.1 exonuclease domain-containing protein [Bacteroidales bacterium]